MAERPNLDVALDDLIKAKPAKADRPPQERKERAEKPPHHKERSGGPVKQRGDRDSRRDEPISRGGRGGGRGGGGAHKGGDREWRHDRAPAAPRQQQIAPNPMMAGFYPGPPFMNPAAFFPQQAPVSKAPISLGAKVLVTNLDKEITAEDLREIFGQVGELKAVSLQFGADNKPKGVAEIVYRHRSGAEQAVREFDGREVDDVRIRVRIIGNDGESAAAPAHHMMAAAAPPAAAMFAPFGMGAGHHGAVGGAPSFAQIAAATTAGAGGKNREFG
jgi:RNA recognition motif. (a.k.a. RRM, RBD, or RNP domain)